MYVRTLRDIMANGFPNSDLARLGRGQASHIERDLNRWLQSSFAWF